MTNPTQGQEREEAADAKRESAADAKHEAGTKTPVEQPVKEQAK